MTRVFSVAWLELQWTHHKGKHLQRGSQCKKIFKVGNTRQGGVSEKEKKTEKKYNWRQKKAFFLK